MNSDVLGIGVVGCGRAAVELHLPALARLPRVKVTALCDSDASRMKSIGESHRGLSRYEDFRGLLSDPSVQIVLIAAPTRLHHDVFLTAMDAGKYVYLEKPLAPDLAQAGAMVSAAARSGARPVLGFNLRSHRLVRAARECIRSGRLGRVLALRTVLVGGIRLEDRVPWQRRRAEGGGAVYELGSHHFDLWRFLLDSEVTEVRAQIVSNGADDSAVSVSAGFVSGALATSFLALAGPVAHEVEVIGETARLRFSLYRADSLEIQPAGRVTRLTGWLHELPGALRAARLGGDYRDSYRVHWLGFLQSLANGEPPATLQDGLESLRIALAAFESCASGVSV